MQCPGCNSQISRLTTAEPASFTISVSTDSKSRVELIPDDLAPELVTHECGTSFEVLHGFDNH